MIPYKVLTVVGEPVSLDAAKMHIKALPGEYDEDDDIILPMIRAAREYCENITGRALTTQTIKAYPSPLLRVVRLPKPPIISITAVRYFGADGSAVEAASNDYVLDDVAGNVVLLRVPGVALRAVNPIEIEYEAGYEVLPDLIRQAMLLLIGHWYINREAVATGAVTTIEIEMTTRALLRQYRVWWF